MIVLIILEASYVMFVDGSQQLLNELCKETFSGIGTPDHRY